MADEIIFEFCTIGDTVRVTAISASSLVEVTVVAPAAAPRHDLLRLAERKLRAAEARAAAGPPEEEKPERGRHTASRGLLV